MSVHAKDDMRRRIEAKRLEIEGDRQALSEGQLRRAEKFGYGKEREEESYGYVSSRDQESDQSHIQIIDGKLVMSHRYLRQIAIPRSIDVVQLRSLIALTLRGNCLRALEAHALAPLASLEFLDVAENELERLCPLGTALTAPQSLDEDEFSDSDNEETLIRKRNINTMSEWAQRHPGPQSLVLCSFPPRLIALDASRNRIARLALGPGGAPYLQRLNLSHNKIRFISQDLKGAPQLMDLDARHNLLQHNAQLKHLTHLRKLRAISLTGNPITKDPRYKLKLCVFAPNLRHALDNPRECAHLKHMAYDYFSPDLLSSAHTTTSPPPASTPSQDYHSQANTRLSSSMPRHTSHHRDDRHQQDLQREYRHQSKNDPPWPDVGALARSIWSSSPRQSPPSHPPTDLKLPKANGVPTPQAFAPNTPAAAGSHR